MCTLFHLPPATFLLSALALFLFLCPLSPSPIQPSPPPSSLLPPLSVHGSPPSLANLPIPSCYWSLLAYLDLYSYKYNTMYACSSNTIASKQRYSVWGKSYCIAVFNSPARFPNGENSLPFWRSSRTLWSVCIWWEQQMGDESDQRETLRLYA